jgi:hypothetical protein
MVWRFECPPLVVYTHARAAVVFVSPAGALFQVASQFNCLEMSSREWCGPAREGAACTNLTCVCVAASLTQRNARRATA